MNELKNKMKEEASKRLKMLDLNTNVLSDFVNDEVIYISEHQKIMGMNAGILFGANEEQMKYIKEFEEKTGALVYHAILTPFSYGKCLSVLYVSKYEEEWNFEKLALRNGRIPSYVYNLTNPNYSEAGMISIKKAAGGLIRTA